nr:uncharacterized protein LOC116153380 [Camelus dromedarius]
MVQLGAAGRPPAPEVRAAEPGRRAPRQAPRSGAAPRTAPPAARPRRAAPRPAASGPPPRWRPESQTCGQSRPSPYPPSPPASISLLGPPPKTMNAATWKHAPGHAPFPLYSRLRACFHLTSSSVHLIPALSFPSAAWS